MADSLFQVREFAKRSGVTVRTLHHYDHLGLLKPTVYSESGYRLYSNDDFARLQQIVTLKFIGLSLTQIREVLEGKMLDLASMLRLQRSMMQRKRRQLDMVIQAIDRAEQLAANGGEPDWETFQQIIEVVNMEANMDFFKQYYTQEQLDGLAKRWESEQDMINKTHAEWGVLIKEAESLVGEDPGSERVQELAGRWLELVGRFTQGDPGLEESLGKLYADRENWPEKFQSPFGGEVQALMGKAIEIRNQRG